jgi:hypothetical protein
LGELIFVVIYIKRSTFTRNMRTRYKILLIAFLLGVLAFIGLAVYGKRIYRYFYPRPEVPCCVKSPNAACCVSDTLTTEGKQYVFQYLGFDADRFMRLGDSLLTSIVHVPIHLTCNISWRTQNEGTKYIFEFDPGKGNRILQFSLSISLYHGVDGMEQDFKELQRGGQKDTGLTYGNDDIWKTNNKIIWLSVGCAYASFNQKVIRQFVLETVDMGTLTGGIVCICGDNCD